MPKVKSKVKTTFYFSEAQYWCICYLMAVTNRTASEIIEEAIKYSVRYIDKGETKPRKLRIPDKKIRQNANITRETLIAVALIKINKELFGWSNTDFGRYGLNHTLSSYGERYPDMKKIIKKYEA